MNKTKQQKLNNKLKHLQEEADRFDTMRPKLVKQKKEHGKK